MPAHRQGLLPLSPTQSKEQQLLQKSLFPPWSCCCPSASLWMHVWVGAAAGGLQRREGPEIAVKKALGNLVADAAPAILLPTGSGFPPFPFARALGPPSDLS